MPRESVKTGVEHPFSRTRGDDRPISELAGRKRSKLEERFAPFLRLHNLPMPRFNDWIVLGPNRYQVDCHWPGSGEIVLRALLLG
jgi:hypothetical protein